MEIGRAAANLLIETASGAAPSPAQRRFVGSEASARSRGQGPSSHGERPDKMEPSNTHKPAQTEVYEKE